jgi:hypothetical protein
VVEAKRRWAVLNDAAGDRHPSVFLLLQLVPGRLRLRGTDGPFDEHHLHMRLFISRQSVFQYQEADNVNFE